MYALIDMKGKQYKAEKGALLRMDRIDAEKGASLDFDSIMLISDNGTPEDWNSIYRRGKGDWNCRGSDQRYKGHCNEV